MNTGQVRDRRDAGRQLAAKLSADAHRWDVLVLALPRGGVRRLELSLALDAPLEIFAVRKLGVPGYEELAMGAVATVCACSVSIPRQSRGL
jgi:predicted phosphoribosyltransferase